MMKIFVQVLVDPTRAVSESEREALRQSVKASVKGPFRVEAMRMDNIEVKE